MNNLQNYVNKNSALTVLLLIIAAMIVYRITPVTVDQNVKLTISKNRTGIQNLYQARDIESTQTVWVDHLNLLHKSRFMHAKLGVIANHSDDFFVDIDHTINVKREGNYRFMMGSDDGISLTVDGRLICESVGDRPFQVQPCYVHLTKGSHHVKIAHYQGYGNSGMTVQFARDNEKMYYFGEKNPDVDF